MSRPVVSHAGPGAGRGAQDLRAEPNVVTVAMLPEMAAAFMAEWEGERTPWFDLLCDGLRLAPDAQVIGFEVVGVEACLDFH